jgi:hypothetical protein
MDETEPPAKKIGQDALFATKKKKQTLTVSVKTKNQLMSASSKKNDRYFEIWEHLDQMVYHQSCYKNHLSSARRSQEEQEGTKKPAFLIKNCLICNRIRNKEGKQMRWFCFIHYAFENLLNIDKKKFPSTLKRLSRLSLLKNFSKH